MLTKDANKNANQTVYQTAIQNYLFKTGFELISLFINMILVLFNIFAFVGFFVIGCNSKYFCSSKNCVRL